VPLKRRAAPRAETMIWDGSAWRKALAESATNPNLRVSIWRGTDEALVYPRNIDNMSAANDVLHSIACKAAFNETSWDRWRNNTEVTVLPSATRTTSGNSADQTNFNARGVILFLKVTAVGGTSPTLGVFVQAKDPTSASYFTIARFSQMTAVGSRELIVYPGATDTQVEVADHNDIPISRTWRIWYSIGGTNPSFEFSVGASYIV